MIRFDKPDEGLVFEALPFNDNTSIFLWSTDGGPIYNVHLTHAETHELVGQLYAALERADREGWHEEA